MNALNNAEVGKYINEHFTAAFQKVATFKITANGQKQGGNVATYFCAPDGRVLHVVAGPVNAQTMLKESKWIVETAEKLIADSKGDGATFKAMLRTAHAERLKKNYGITVEPVTFEPTNPADESGMLSYRDPSGRPLAPVLPPPPVDGPDVAFPKQTAAGSRPSLEITVMDRASRRPQVLANPATVHRLMSAHGLAKIETLYGTVFEGILGEKISTKPVNVATPFSWLNRDGARQR